MSILGNRVIRKEDPALLRGAGRYADNVRIPGARRVTFVRSTIPHGLIRRVDTSEASTVPGVVGVFTATDLPFGPMPAPTFFPQIDARFVRWPLANDAVRYVGEPIVAIVSEDRESGADAAERVQIDYDALPTVATLEESMREDVLLFPDFGTNVVATLDLPPVDGMFDDADVVITQQMVNRRIAPAPMEGRSTTATWDGERLTVHVATQGIAACREMLAALFSLDRAAVRVIATDVGGGFGAKGLMSNEELVVVWLALHLGGTTRWAETRTENLLAMGHGRAQLQTVSIGATHEGRIVGLRYDVAQEAGGHADIGSGLPAMTMLMAAGVYAVPKIEFTSRSWLTTTTPVGSFRGAGRPEATYALERALDVLARRLRMDPAELRRRNFIEDGAFPVTTAVGTVYDSGAYGRALDAALAAAGYDELRAEQRRRREAGSARVLGIGVSCYVEITGAMPGPEPATVEVHEDGTATVFSGSNPNGQGHVTSWAMVAADRLGIPIDRIDVVYGDTDVAPPGGVTGGSRSAQICGTVVGHASDAVVDRARELAAGLLEAAVDDVVLDRDGGVFHVVGAPAISRSWTDVVRAGGERKLAADATFESTPTYPFGANVAVVEVDLETGQVRLLRIVGCDDAGTLLNPLLVEGQLHGGFAQGIAQALVEEVMFDEDGNPLTTNFADYGAVSAAELPSFELVHQETPTPLNDLGAKGIGESGTVGSTPCVANAVVDALSHLGVEHIDIPTTSQRVWRAIQVAAASE